MLTTAEAVLFLEEHRGIVVKTDTVKHWCQQGRFPNARRIGGMRRGSWLIPQEDLRDFNIPTQGRPRREDRDEHGE